jgi:peptidoglycan/xylan/chitin deacetylase (PgdA/CDA1 family)
MRIIVAVLLLVLTGCEQTQSPHDHTVPSPEALLPPTSLTPFPTMREGLVVFQFDDGYAGHYSSSRILDTYGFKGSFGIITGRLGAPGRLTRAQVVDMAARGHEIHDHTLNHDSAFWGDVANAPLWRDRIEKSLAIFDEMGLSTRGWNQPGGAGQGWSKALRDTLAQYYDYAAGRVGLAYDQRVNFHWRLRDDPLSLGRGGITSWGYNGGSCAAGEVSRIRTRLVDGYFQGLVVVPLFHHVLAADSTEWALDRLCSFVRQHDLKNATMAEAVRGIKTTPNGDRDQIPNRGFWWDLDNNNRPDGWLNCSYAPQEVQDELGARAAELRSGSCTTIYGAMTGTAVLTFAARASVPADRVVVRLEITEIYPMSPVYSYIDTYRDVRVSLTDEWQKFRIPLKISPRTDRVTIRLLQVNARMYMAGASFLAGGRW